MSRIPPAAIAYLTIISIVVIVETERIIRCGELID